MQQRKDWRTFEEAREYIRRQGIKNLREWYAYCQSGQKPDDIPTNPRSSYKGEWLSWGNWLGTGNIATRDREWRPFEEAREYVRALELKSQEEWVAYCKSRQKPDDIPANPRSSYKDEFKGFGDWLGTGNVAKYERTSQPFRPFLEAREFVRTLKLKNGVEWYAYCQSGQKPDDIPSDPRKAYKNEWQGRGDWLGTGNIHAKDKVWRPYLEAREYVRALKLKSSEEWETYCTSGQKPSDIPSRPARTYESNWRGMGDWLGVVNKWTRPALLALLEDLRLHIGTLDENEIYMILQQSGALPTLFFAIRTRSVQSVLRDLRENDGRVLEAAIKDVTEEMLEASQEESGDSRNGEIDGESLPDIEKVFGELSRLVTPDGLRAVDMINPIYGIDEEIAEYLISNRVNALWEAYINGEEETIINALKDKGGRYFNEIKRRFLAEKASVESLPIPPGWDFKDDQGRPCQPFLMQRWTAWQIQERRRIGNWSGVGSGKTLSAILASRVIDARVTVIVANNATIEETANGWEKQILNAYPDSIIHMHEHIRENLIFDRDRHHYVLLNYEKFQVEGKNRDLLLETLLSFKPNFIVLDEIHFVKQKNERASNRREALEYLIRRSAEINPSLHVLGMSATPVINNLQEAKKLLETVTGEVFSHVGTVHTINNALTLHRLLMLHGLRYRPRYEQEMPPVKLPEVRNDLEKDLQIAQGSILATERTLLPARLEIARPYFEKGTLVYTRYIEGMVNPICRYLEDMGLTVGLYIGSNKSGLRPFLNEEVDILLGSSPVGTGLDGLQRICNRLVMLSLPWTNAEYEQIIGRLRRLGQTEQVEIIIPQVVLEREGETWSWDESRLDCIEYKRTLSDCVLDSRIPDTVNINQQEFLKKSREKLEQWIEMSSSRLAIA